MDGGGRRFGAVLLALVVSRSASADTVTVPLAIDYDFLAASVRDQLGADRQGTAVLWGTEGACHTLVLRDVAAGRGGDAVRVTAQTTARLGFSILGLCLSPLAWDGYLETTGRPEIGADWHLRLRDLQSQVFDREHRPTRLLGRLWDLVRGRVEERLADFDFDLGPPLEEARSLIRASVPPERGEPVLKALGTLRPVGASVDDQGVKVLAALDVPAAPQQTPAVPEEAPSPDELTRWQTALENWDAFLVFVIKDLGLLHTDEETRRDLLTLLLDSRQQFLAALASGPESGVDPVRQLFLTEWGQLRRIVRRAALHGGLEDRALRYAAFLAAGDLLEALDAAGPGLGIEISADGLRRLARVLEPNFAGDPIAYSDAPDAALQRLFGFHEPASSGPGEPPPPNSRWWAVATAYAAEPPATDDLQRLAHDLDRTVPAAETFQQYRATVNRLLAVIADRTWHEGGIEDRFVDLYRNLVPAVAWQESCWRQFVSQKGRVTFLLSRSGDVGIMQVNRRTWRGFFDLRKLEWDVTYNAGAGAEILFQLLRRYGVREAEGGVENAARATYSAYNGGPGAYRRYRAPKGPRHRAIDRAFWGKYQKIAAGEALDFVLCVEEWEHPPEAADTTGPAG